MFNLKGFLNCWSPLWPFSRGSWDVLLFSASKAKGDFCPPSCPSWSKCPILCRQPREQNILLDAAQYVEGLNTKMDNEGKCLKVGRLKSVVAIYIKHVRTIWSVFFLLRFVFTLSFPLSPSASRSWRREKMPKPWQVALFRTGSRQD